jgi:hypothetical protein
MYRVFDFNFERTDICLHSYCADETLCCNVVHFKMKLSNRSHLGPAM